VWEETKFAKTLFIPQLRARDRCHVSRERTHLDRFSCSWEYPDCSSDSNASEHRFECSETVQGNTEPMQMACIREYMHYPATQGLESASTGSDEACPIDEKGWTWEVQMHPCSDPENCSSTEEHWQPYKVSDPESDKDKYLSDEDYSFEENDNISDSESENYSDEEDHIHEDSDESEERHSCEENDDILESESEAYTSDEEHDYDSDESC